MRYLVMSDVHANLNALKAVLRDAADRYDLIWFLGDVVGYGPNPNECIDLLRDLKCSGIAGNHDWAALGKLNIRQFNPEARHVLVWTRSVLSSSSIRFLESLETRAVPDMHFTLVHGSPRHPIWEYVLHPASAAANLDYFSTRCCLVGHTHNPVIYQASGAQPNTCHEIGTSQSGGSRRLPDSRLIINPGSVGQPRDGDPRASYAILDTDSDTYDHRRVHYPVACTQEAMQDLGFPTRLIRRLALGR